MSGYSSDDENGLANQSFTNFNGSNGNKQSTVIPQSGSSRTNNELTKYKDILYQLSLLQTIDQNRKEDKKLLSVQEQAAEQKERTKINDLFAQAKYLIENDKDKYSKEEFAVAYLMLPAAYFGNRDTIEYLLENHLEKLTKYIDLSDAVFWATYNVHDTALALLLDNSAVLKTVIEKCPKKLGNLICRAANNNHNKVLGLLVSKDILEQLRYNSKESKEVFDKIKDHLTALNNDQYEDVSQEVKDIIEQYLKTIEEINRYPEVLEALKKLSNQSTPDQDEINKKFAEAINLANKNNVNYQQDNYTLLELAAYFDKDEIIKNLLTNHLETLKEEPEQLGYAIIAAAYNGHHKALGLLLNNQAVLKTVIDRRPGTLGQAIAWAAEEGHHLAVKPLITKDILEKLQKQCRVTFQDLEESLNIFKDNNDLTKEVKTVVTEGLKNIKELRNRKTAKAAVAAGGVVAGGAASVVGGTFVSALLAKKGLNLVKDTRLVTNHLLPAFNKVNDQLIKISSKLDLNKLAKAFTDPKIAALMIGMSAILGVISSIVAGVGAHKAQKMLLF
jgi:DNA-binding Lrp family transcriptional regulator